MSSLARSVSHIQSRARILRDRPYHPWWLMPLAEHLDHCGYGNSARGAVIDHIEDGGFLTSLVVAGSLESADLAGAEAALESGRRRRAARRLTVEPFLPGPDEPDPFDEVAEFEALPVPYEPTPSDWKEYAAVREAEDFATAVREHDEALRIWLTFFPK